MRLLLKLVLSKWGYYYYDYDYDYYDYDYYDYYYYVAHLQPINPGIMIHCHNVKSCKHVHWQENKEIILHLQLK